MPTGHRAIWRPDTVKRNRVLDTNRVYAAAEALLSLVEDWERVGKGTYRITPAVALAAITAAIQANDSLQRLRQEVDS
jgi:hypothetical protein